MEKIEYSKEIRFILGDQYYDYRVYDTYLEYKDGSYNDQIFKALGINEETKIQMANKYYGYSPCGGEWPEYRHKDFDAATELVKRLYDLCNIYNTKEK